MKTEIPKNNKNADSYHFVTHHYHNDHNYHTNAQWESARPNLDLPKIEARSEVSA